MHGRGRAAAGRRQVLGAAPQLRGAAQRQRVARGGNQLVEIGYRVVTKVDTTENLADLLTKPLDPTPFERLRRLLLMCWQQEPFTPCRGHVE